MFTEKKEFKRCIEDLKSFKKEGTLTQFGEGKLAMGISTENLIICSSSLLLKENYKTGFDEWKIENGYKKDIKHKCYFKGNKAYFDFDLIEIYDKEIKSNL